MASSQKKTEDEEEFDTSAFSDPPEGSQVSMGELFEKQRKETEQKIEDAKVK